MPLYLAVNVRGCLLKVPSSIIFGQSSKVPPSLFFYGIVNVRVEYCQHTTATLYKVDFCLHITRLTPGLLVIIRFSIYDNDMKILRIPE